MRRVTLLCLTLALGGCESAVSKEQRKLEMLKRSGAGSTELCVQARQVEAAALNAGDDAQFQRDKLSADSQCLTSQLDKADR